MCCYKCVSYLIHHYNNISGWYWKGTIQTHFHFCASMNFSNTRLHEKFISDLDVFTTVQFLIYKTLGDFYLSLTSEDSNGENFFHFNISSGSFFFLKNIWQWLDSLHFKLGLIFEIVWQGRRGSSLIIPETWLENCVLYVLHFTKRVLEKHFFNHSIILVAPFHHFTLEDV